ncbi:hypothetical protein D3C75_1384370 [compost metagenome]
MDRVVNEVPDRHANAAGLVELHPCAGAFLPAGQHDDGLSLAQHGQADVHVGLMGLEPDRQH